MHCTTLHLTFFILHCETVNSLHLPTFRPIQRILLHIWPILSILLFPYPSVNLEVYI